MSKDIFQEQLNQVNQCTSRLLTMNEQELMRFIDGIDEGRLRKASLDEFNRNISRIINIYRSRKKSLGLVVQDRKIESKLHNMSYRLGDTNPRLPAYVFYFLIDNLSLEACYLFCCRYNLPLLYPRISPWHALMVYAISHHLPIPVINRMTEQIRLRFPDDSRLRPLTEINAVLDLATAGPAAASDTKTPAAAARDAVQAGTTVAAVATVATADAVDAVDVVATVDAVATVATVAVQDNSADTGPVMPLYLTGTREFVMQLTDTDNLDQVMAQIIDFDYLTDQDRRAYLQQLAREKQAGKPKQEMAPDQAGPGNAAPEMAADHATGTFTYTARRISELDLGYEGAGLDLTTKIRSILDGETVGTHSVGKRLAFILIALDLGLSIAETNRLLLMYEQPLLYNITSRLDVTYLWSLETRQPCNAATFSFLVRAAERIGR